MRVAVFTMVYNEAVFLPAWVAHYSEQVGGGNVFVIDVGSDDGSTSDLSVNCLRLPRAYLDEERRTSFVHHFHASLLSYHDVVVFCDADEFLVADPAIYSGLIPLMKDRPESVIAPIGLNVVHVLGHDGPLDREARLLRQRQHAQFDSLYCKPLVGRKPVPWTPGFHACSGPFEICTSLYLFHLKAVDQDIFLSEFRIKKAAGISPEALAKGHGVQLGMTEQELMAVYFPVHASNLQGLLGEDFTFMADLRRYIAAGFRDLWRSKGSVGVIPERFRDCLPALRGA